MGALFEAPPEERWLLAQARDRIFRREAWDGDIAAGLKGASAIATADPVLQELKPLFRSISNREPVGIVATRQPPAEALRPSWKFAWWDIEGDGKNEIVLAGGTSPAPYYAVFQRAGPESHSWRILQDAPFRFAGSATRSGRAYLFGVFDGHGLATPILAIDSIATDHADKIELRFDLLEWPTGNSEKSAIAYVTTRRVSKLRAAPVQDDAPNDRGMGIDFPGNLFQTLAIGSSGWVLHTEKVTDGTEWAFCCFVSASPMGAAEPSREMRTPRRLRRAPLASAKNVIMGWLPSRDLVSE